MKVLKKSPLLDRDTAEEVHNALDEKSHKKAHKGEKASFQTVEEENRFRNFIVKSNPDYATTIGLDPTNEEGAKGVLNNPTIQKAYEEFGTQYQDFVGLTDVFKKKTTEIEEKGVTIEQRTKTKPTGWDPFTKTMLYEEYDENKSYSLDIPNDYFGGGEWTEAFMNVGVKEGTFADEVSQEEFIERFKSYKLWKGEKSYAGPGANLLSKFDVEATGGVASDRIKITNRVTGAKIEFYLNTESTRESYVSDNKPPEDFHSWSEINTMVHKFVNGFAPINYEEWNYGEGTTLEKLNVKYPNPLLVLFLTIKGSAKLLFPF